MSGIRNSFINLDSPRNVFYPGQVILGSVVFEIEQPFSLAVLYADFVGEAKVDWKELEPEIRNDMHTYKEVEYVGRENYFTVRQLLAGGNTPVDLPLGTHTYKFSYQLPAGIPSSFSGKRGGVTYCIRATLELMGQTHLKKELDKVFEVIAPFDLNLGNARVKEPIDIEFEEVVGCSCLSSDTVNVRIHLPVSGYCPGQVIPVSLDVTNNSNVEIRKMIFQILTRERYRTQRPVSEYIPPERVLSTVTKGAIMSGTKKNLTVEVTLPELIAPNLENCRIIDVEYFFRAIIKFSGCSDDFEDESEICLGLIPLQETVNGEYVHPLSESLPIGPIPIIPVTNEEEPKHEENQQSTDPGQTSGFSTYPGFSDFSNFPGFHIFSGFPTPDGYPSSASQSTDPNVQKSYFVQVQEQHYSSTDPSKNFKIDFTTTSPELIPMNIREVFKNTFNAL